MSYKRPENQLRAIIFDLVVHWVFEVSIMVCIILNILTMALSYEGSSKEYQSVLEDINLGFTIIFILEAVLKIIAFNPKGFWISGWNRFDLFVVVSSVVDIILNLAGGTQSNLLRVGP